MNNKIAIYYTTISSLEAAEKLAEQAILTKHAACVNIVPNAISIYEWEGKLEKSSEFLMIFKTSRTKSKKLYRWILDNHPYEVPAIITTILETTKEFANYVKIQTTSLA